MLDAFQTLSGSEKVIPVAEACVELKVFLKEANEAAFWATL